LITEQKGYLKDHPSDISTQAVLAALYSFTSPAEAAQYSSSLPSISSFTHTIDAKHLESQGISTATTITQKRKTPGKTRVKTRVRGGKTFDSSNEVDPERWLPLRDRSYYKPAKSKRRKVGGATQGGIVEAESMSRTGSDHEVKKADVVGKKKKKGRR
jgi:signal recognition particle subunit SRP72